MAQPGSRNDFFRTVFSARVIRPLLPNESNGSNVKDSLVEKDALQKATSHARRYHLLLLLFFFHKVHILVDEDRPRRTWLVVCTQILVLGAKIQKGRPLIQGNATVRFLFFNKFAKGSQSIFVNPSLEDHFQESYDQFLVQCSVRPLPIKLKTKFVKFFKFWRFQKSRIQTGQNGFEFFNGIYLQCLASLHPFVLGNLRRLFVRPHLPQQDQNPHIFQGINIQFFT